MLRLTKPQRLIYDMGKFHGGSISVDLRQYRY